MRTFYGGMKNKTQHLINDVSIYYLSPPNRTFYEEMEKKTKHPINEVTIYYVNPPMRIFYEDGKTKHSLLLTSVFIT